MSSHKSDAEVSITLEVQLPCDEISSVWQRNLNDLKWYDEFLDKKFKSLPRSITESLSSPHTLFGEVAKLTKTGNNIEEIAVHLQNLNLIPTNEAKDTILVARSITFAIIGWQTMLYEPAFGTCPPSQVAIADVLDGFTGQAFMTLKQDQSRFKTPLPEFLLGFGLMLPRENLCLSTDREDCESFDKLSIILPDEFNAALLKSLAKINIKWIDVMSPHLEFDKATNTLFLFRYPSFCIANSIAEGTNDETVLHSCVTKYSKTSQWASKAEITQLLIEIPLSYRLLFGQTGASRRLFESMSVFEPEYSGFSDSLLARLCSDKCSPLSTPDRAFYRLSRDFPILRSRIAILQHQMSILKPRGWKELWNDKRDSAQWLTFWAVIAIGGSGIFLSLVQVVLQAAQLAGAK